MVIIELKSDGKEFLINETDSDS